MESLDIPKLPGCVLPGDVKSCEPGGPGQSEKAKMSRFIHLSLHELIILIEDRQSGSLQLSYLFI